MQKIDQMRKNKPLDKIQHPFLSQIVYRLNELTGQNIENQQSI